jgi:uncharacterized protein YdeI (YjbR/CyaY-like superfamily)
VSGEATYFATPADFRRWLAKNHAKATELLVGFYTVGSGKPSMTWPQSVDEALCVGWIDGVRRRVDDERYTIRFTPRRPGSIWSKVNVAKAEALKKSGRMKAAGLKAYEARSDKKTGIYSFEREATQLAPAYEKRLQRNKAAWTFLQAKAPWYRKKVVHWVMGARQEETRLKRLEKLIEACAEGRVL